MRDIGESYVIKKTELNLPNGGKYYMRIQITDLLGMATIACSDGVTIDTTPPIPRGFVVGKNGMGFVPSLRRVSGKFQDFLDIESPIVRYEWKLMDEKTGSDATSFVMIPITQRYPLLFDLNLIAGKKYTALLKGTNAAGLYATVNVSGIVPDNTIPTCNGRPLDVLTPNDIFDKDFVRDLTNLTAMFSCKDEESGIRFIEAAVGTYPGGENVHPFVNLDNLTTFKSHHSNATWVTFSDVNLTSLVRYYITIKFQNNAGLIKTIFTDGILIDTTSPTVLPTYIRDGLKGIDARFSSQVDEFSAHWENAFSDAESGIGEFFVGLGKTPGSDDVTPMRSNGLNTQAIISSSSLESGVKYYITVTACNRVHMCVNGSSNGAMVDFTPPHTGTVIAGDSGPPLEVTWVNKAAWARWYWCPADRDKLKITDGTCNALSFYDNHSGVKHFGLSVFSYDSAKLITPVKTVGRVAVSGIHVAIPNGAFSVVVEAEDRAGVKSNSVSEPFIVDVTPPKILTLHHGRKGHKIMFTRNSSHVFSAYFEMEEDYSNIVKYSVGVSSYPQGNDVIGFVSSQINDVGNVVKVNWTLSDFIKLMNGRKYYITVKVSNSAGLSFVSSSTPLIFDDQAPFVAYVFDGWDTIDARYQSFSNIYRLHWSGVTDFSGVKETKVCLSSRPTLVCDVHAFVKIPNSLTSYTFTNLNLQSGSYCFAHLLLTDRAGNVGSYWTNGVLLDTSPPVRGSVFNGNQGTNVLFQRENNILYARWQGFYENETSIDHYELAFGTSPNTSNIQPFTDVGLHTSSVSSNLQVSELQNGITYYARVIAVNVIGVPSKIATSNGIIVDSTPPVFNRSIYDGAVFDHDYTSQTNSLSASWRCKDADSGIARVLIGFGTLPGMVDVVFYQNVLPYQTTFKMKNITLIHGFRYFATVKCINHVGLQTVMSSDGVTLDLTPPLISYINDGDNLYQDYKYMALGPKVNANLQFTDPESHIAIYRIAIIDVANGLNIYDPLAIRGLERPTRVSFPGNLLVHGQRYAFKVEAQNGAGLNTTGVSNGFLVDGTGPDCFNVNDVTTDGKRSSYIGEVRKLIISFHCNDTETGIRSYQFAIKDINTANYIMSFHTIKGISIYSTRVVVDGSGRQAIELQNGGRYAVGIRATNNVFLSKEYWTSGVVIDTTPPIFSDVKTLFRVQMNGILVTWQLHDLESGIESLSWMIDTSPDLENPQNFNNISHNVSRYLISSVSFKLGQTVYIYLRASNKAQRYSTFVTSGVVIDRSPPSPGLVSANFVVPANYDGNPNVTYNASFVVKWSGFVDVESGLRSYAWGISSSGKLIKNLSDAYYSPIKFTGTINGYVIQGQTIYSGRKYSVCVRVMNGAGLSRTSCSNEFLVRLGKFTPGIVYDGPFVYDRDFQLDDKAVWLHWSGFKDPVYGIDHYKWCYGKATKQAGDDFNCSSPLTKVNPPLKTTAHQFHNVSLLHGKHYSVKVKASNVRHQTVSAFSDGFTVDRTGPSSGVFKVGGSHGTRVVYIVDVTPPIVTWSMHEGESAMKEYQFGIGSAPGKDDLYSFMKLDGGNLSLDFAEINFNLSHGLMFYLTVIGENVLGLQSTMTSPQIIVDRLPPTPGSVRDGNDTVDVDYQSNLNQLSASWDAFLDPESGVNEYSYCIGTSPDTCDITNKTSVNLDRHAKLEVGLEQGIRYFVIVTAVNGAGLSTTSSSNGFVMDASPPTVNRIVATSVVALQITSGNKTAKTDDIVSNEETLTANNMNSNVSISNIFAILTNPLKISAVIHSVFDHESDIKKIIICATTVKEDCDLSRWQVVQHVKERVDIIFKFLLNSGTVFFLKVKAENGAGLETVAFSRKILVDTTPPHRGTVKVDDKVKTVFLNEEKLFSASWSGFYDPESNIKEYDWKICLANQQTNCLSAFTSSGLNTSLVLNDLALEPLAEYQLVIKAVNIAGLEMIGISNSFVMDNTSPQSGIAFIGSVNFKNRLYQSSFSEILASWRGFTDKESGIERYEVCVGLSSGICDVTPFRDYGLNNRATVFNLNLTHNETYYVTVRATNGARLTSIATTKGITVDLTSPVGGVIRDGEGTDLDITLHDTFIRSNWDEFSDLESGISMYVVCAGTIRGSCDVLPLTSLGISLTAMLQINPAVSSGTIVYVTLKIYNGGGGMTEVYSDGILIDSTPPVGSKVEITSDTISAGEVLYLTNKRNICSSWYFNDNESYVINYQYSLCWKHNIGDCPVSNRNLNNKTSLCIEEPSLTEGQSYVIKIIALNEVGLSTSLTSSTFIIDTTEPDIGEIKVSNPLGNHYMFVSSDIIARWSGFVDLESGISNYYVCLGTKPITCDVSKLKAVVNTSSYAWYNLSLVHNEEYFVSLMGVNNAGLSTNLTASQPVTVDKTALLPSQVFDGSHLMTDVDFQESSQRVSANWFKVEDPESDVISLKWCVGSSPGSCDFKSSASLEISATKISAYLDQPVDNGNRFYITLNATNGAGVETIMASDGVTVDYTPPTGGLVIDGTDADVDYVKDGDTVHGRWLDFQDVESGIQSYQFALCQKENVTFCPKSFSNTGIQTNISITGLELENGVAYVIIVRAVNNAGLSNRVNSDGFIVDATAPESGRVFISSLLPFTSISDHLSVRWQNFFDPESDIAQYEICLGTTQETCNEIDFQYVGRKTNHTLTKLRLRHHETYFVTIKATNKAGMSTLVSSDEIKIDLTAPLVIKQIVEHSADINNNCSSGVGKCNTTQDTKASSPVSITCSKEIVKASWLQYEDRESGIFKLEWCVESLNGECDILPWEDLSINLTEVAAIVSLEDHSFVKIAVRFTNGARNTLVIKSDPCSPMKAFPSGFNVVEVENLNKSSSDIDYQANTESIIVSWFSRDNTSSLFSSIQAALTEKPKYPNATESFFKKWHDETFLFKFVDIPRGKQHIRFSGDKLKPYTVYRSLVRSCNKDQLCYDSVSDGIMIAPDAPSAFKIDTTDTIAGTQQQRWQKYFTIPEVPRSMVEETYYIPDPLSLQVKAHSSNVSNVNSSVKQNLEITYQASVYRVLSGQNETRNVTINIKTIFNHSYIHNDNNVCCKKTNDNPRVVHPDRQIKPVQRTNAFGFSISSLNHGLLAVSSKHSAYIVPTSSDETTLFTLVTLNSSYEKYVKVSGKNDLVLLSGDGKLMVFKIDEKDLKETSRILIITNCNTTSSNKAASCVKGAEWSTSRAVGEQFGFDGTSTIAVSGLHPIEKHGVVALFTNESGDWRLLQVLAPNKSSSSSIRVIAINNDFIVIVGSEINVYAKKFNDIWSNDKKLSRTLSNEVISVDNMYLTKKNELFVLSVKNRRLLVFHLKTGSGNDVVLDCRYIVSPLIFLTGSLDVMEGNTTIAVIGIMSSDGQDGCEILMYENKKSCKRIGTVVTKTGPRYDSGQMGASVAIVDQMVFIGSPGLLTWPSSYVEAGTGRVYATTFCNQNFVRRKLYGNKHHINCELCDSDHEAYPGFEEKCTNCNMTICVNRSVLNFRVSHCDKYPCEVIHDRLIKQNISQDNITVTEFVEDFEEDGFYQPGSENSYFIRITQKSVSGLVTVSDSFPFSLDNTSPEAGLVYDGLGSDENRNCSANTTLSSEHQCSSRSLSETDLDYTNNTASISARWIDFRDNESDIENVFWCIGSKILRDDIMACENATSHSNQTLTGLTLRHNETYYVTVLACNYAGLCTARSSDGVLVDTTPPVIHFVRDGLIGPDIDFQVFTNIIFGNWEAEDPESGIVSYEIGWGSSPGLDDVWEFQEIGNAKAYYAKFSLGDLIKGNKYYITVIAINAAGLESESMSSNGIVVGRTEFIFAKNDSGSFFFDTVNVNANESMENDSSKIGNTFGTLDVPSGAVDEEVKFQVYSLGEKEMKNGTDDNTTIVDPQVVTPPKHFKLGNYSFQIKAYEPKNNSLMSKYHFKKPVTITLFYDVDQMLNANKKTVSNDVTTNDVNPVLLLWDITNKTWYDASKTCPKPWSQVDRAAKLLRVKVCHLTQFALFWTFIAEYGIVEFERSYNVDSTYKSHQAVVEDYNNILYSPQKYPQQIIFDVARRKGSTGNVTVTWSVSSHMGARIPFSISPSSGVLKFAEGQWNSSVELNFGSMPSHMSEVVVILELLNISGGAMFGNLTSLRIIFPRKIKKSDDKTWKILVPVLASSFFIFLLFVIIVFLVFKHRRRNKELQPSFRRKDDASLGKAKSKSDVHEYDSRNNLAETSFINKPGHYNPTAVSEQSME